MYLGKHNSVDYKCHSENDEVQKLVRRAAVLPLIPSASVEDVWLNALESINEADIDINTTPFCDYVTEYWVENNRDIWNHFENEGPRKPTIWKAGIIIAKLNSSANEVTMIQYAVGGVRATKRRKYRSIDERIVQLKRD
ncbi:hypothetical protein KUTeg_005874 [Tegillarca granosa]|uniref:Uncharacterized protein n=1 Tax=Tegillarca granosa TaxID=220873 RepID=A0ABQ9FLL2_TEGGR|nr:hypothetical protein KUTeg_005874 [Tegillarca granosa]